MLQLDLKRKGNIDLLFKDLEKILFVNQCHIGVKNI